MNKKCVLAVSGGRTDIQIQLLDTKGERNFYTVGKRDTVSFHQWLQKNELCFSHSDPGASNETNTPPKNNDVAFQDNRFILAGQNGRPTNQPAQELSLPDGKVCLWFPKLSPLIDSLAKDDWQIAGAIVYYTDRQKMEKGRFNEEEPFFIGPLLKLWLCDRLKLKDSQILTYQPEHVLCVNYAEGKKEIEGQGRDYPIYRTIAERIESPLRAAGQAHPDTALCISTLGGIKPISRLIELIGGVFFTGNIRSIQDTEARRNALEFILVDKAISAEQSYQIRKQCIALVQRGEFIGAWGVGKELAGDLFGDDEWTRVLERLALLVNGQWRPPARGSESFPEKALLATQLNYCPRTLLLTLRINSALRRNSVADAMALTANLPDAALLDGVSRFLMIQSHRELGTPERLDALLEENEFIDTFNRRLDLQKSASAVLRKKIIEILNKEIPKARIERVDKLVYWSLNFKWDDALVNPVKAQPETNTLSIVLDPSGNDWLALIDKEEYRDGYPNLIPPLQDICQRLFLPTKATQHSLFDIGRRANGSLTDEQALKQAQKAFIQQGVWIRRNNDSENDLSCQLEPRLIGNLLAALGVVDGELIDEELMTSTIAAMRAKIMR